MREIRENSAKKNFLLIFVIILCICSLYATGEIVRTFSYNEENDYGPTALPRVLQSRVYDDGTVVTRIIRNNTNTSTTDKICVYEMLSLRIIHLNGTVEEKDIKLDIQQFNYCNLNSMDYYLIRKNHILVTYNSATNPDDIDTHEAWGMIIDFDGNVYGRIPFRFPDSKNVLSIVFHKIQLNINREKGFIIYCDAYNGTLIWQQHRIELNGTFTKLTHGTLDVSDSASGLPTVIPTVDEGYAIVYTKRMNYYYTKAEPFLPQSGLFVSFIGYDQMPVSPLLLYQTSLPNVYFSGLTCANLIIQTVQVCTLAIIQSPAVDYPFTTFYAKIDFLSSGSVTNLTVIDHLVPNISSEYSSLPVYPTWEVNSLSFGGYLLICNNYGTIFGYLFGEDDANPIPWGFGEPEPISRFGIYQILPHNNTLLVAQDETNNSWRFQVIDLPKFAGDRDTGYSNLNVKATFPEINSFVNPNIAKISIDFYKPVELSNGNLSVYQVVDDKPYLRQSIPSILCSIENNGNTVIADVLESTFSVSEGSYFIKMDNNFVKDKAYKEPLLGIKENVWSFTTKEKRDAFSPSTTGLLRLTSGGTQLFDSLSQEERNDFFGTLLNELSAAIPVVSSRLNTNRMVKSDTSANEKKYLISVGIKETRNEHENSVASIIRLIDIMIKNKDQTPIGSGQVTGYLDESYGFVQSQDLRTKRLLAFLIVGFFATLFLLLFLLSQRRNSNGNNIVILQLGMIIFDLVMDILFASNNARDIPALFRPSVVFVTMPVGINMILTFYIMKKEYKRPKFHQWFEAHRKFASGFTVLSSANIIALNVLYSNLAGFSFLRVPFSDSAKSMIFWGAVLNIFTADIPQVIIQTLYRYKVDPMYYDIIPLLTLISSVVNLTINVMGRLYQAKNYVRRRSRSTNGTNSTDDSNTVLSSTSDDDEQDLKKLEGNLDENISSEMLSAPSPQNYLGNVPEIEKNEEKIES